MDKNKIIAIISALVATTIYGLNHTIAKVIMPHHIGAFGLVQLRLIGAGFIFLLLVFLLQNKKLIQLII